jgi:hypothetical protein
LPQKIGRVCLSLKQADRHSTVVSRQRISAVLWRKTPLILPALGATFEAKRRPRRKAMLGFRAGGGLRGAAEDVIGCAQGKAFEFIGFGFFENYPKWCPQVVELEPLSSEPVEAGPMARQVTLERGIKSESTFRISAFRPTCLITIAGVSEPFNSSYALEAAGDERTKLAFSFELEELDLAMRPFQKLIRAALQEGAAQTVENLKTLLESPAAQEIRVA